jgi:TolB-like protein
VKILDFGLAHVQPLRPDDAVTLTRPGVVMGTVGYMSPEQLRGDAARPPSDIFALGAVLYEIVSGRRAFGAGTAQDTLSAILRDDPPDLAHAAPSIPAELARIVSHCLEKNPVERFQSARDLAFALKAVGSRETAARRPEGIDSIAVLPFANVIGDPEVEYLSGGVAETIINSLTRLPGLRVTPRSTSFRFKAQDIDPQAIGRKLGVRVVLTGRILQRGDTLIVGAELVDVARQSQLWGERFTRKLADIFSIGSAEVGAACFTCITGEAWPDSDYEIDEALGLSAACDSGRQTAIRELTSHDDATPRRSLKGPSPTGSHRGPGADRESRAGAWSSVPRQGFREPDGRSPAALPRGRSMRHAITLAPPGTPRRSSGRSCRRLIGDR